MNIDFDKVFKENPPIEVCSDETVEILISAENRIKDAIIRDPSRVGDYSVTEYFMTNEKCKQVFDELKKFYVDTNKTQLRITIFYHTSIPNTHYHGHKFSNKQNQPRIVFSIRRNR